LSKMVNDDLIKLAESLGEKLAEKGWRIATAESCTGGGVAAAITSVAGSSAWFGYGLVTYSNEAKQQLLGVDTPTIETYGAVSEQVVRLMAKGILSLSGADIGIAVSGIAGPGGGSSEKPVGGVWFAWMTALGTKVDYRQFGGSRQSVQHQAVMCALDGALNILNKESTV
jgi:nicotinamide-nucleotide amidase